MYQVSSRISQLIASATHLDTAGLRECTLRDIAAGVIRLSEMFTRGGSGIGTSYLEDAQLRQAYLAYYVPVNLAKVQILLSEVEPLLKGQTWKEFRVLDVGGGPGTGSLALLDWVSSTSTPALEALRVTVVDRSPAVLKACTELWHGYLAQVVAGQKLPLQTVECNLERTFPIRVETGVDGGGFHLIVVQNVLSELYCGSSEAVVKRTALVGKLLSALAEDGCLMLIEPALRATSRGLHEVRNNLLANYACSLYSPCLHDQTCPALARPDDWCHEERNWARPVWIEQIDKAAGLIKDALKFSYAIIRKDGRTIVPRNEPYHRVVSELRVMKGEKRVWLCEAGGRSELGRQDKDRSASNAAFEQFHRGAIIKISEIVRKERKGKLSTVGRIPPQATAEIIRSA